LLLPQYRRWKHAGGPTSARRSRSFDLYARTLGRVTRRSGSGVGQ
jgi:hypothetical protein